MRRARIRPGHHRLDHHRLRRRRVVRRAVVHDQTPRGCLANILIGILGGLLGGFLARQLLGVNEVFGWIGAFIVAFVGAVIVRWLLRLGNRT